MLKHRVIPILMWDGVQAVQSVQFKRPHRKVGSLMQHVRTMEARNIDELILLDVNATEEDRKPLFKEIEEFTKELFCPLTVGGGIYTLDDIGRLIQHCGADKVAICGAALMNLGFVAQAANKYGSQAIVGVVNAKNDSTGYNVFSNSYSCDNAISVSGYAATLEEYGAGEILLTSVDNNGKRCGYDGELIEQVSKVVNIPLIANGGCGKPLDMVGAIAYGADACAASSMFLFTDHTPIDCSKEIGKAGLPTRLDALKNTKLTLNQELDIDENLGLFCYTKETRKKLENSTISMSDVMLFGARLRGRLAPGNMAVGARVDAALAEIGKHG